MLRAARGSLRTAGHDNVAFHQGDATALPVEDASFDAALSVQVLEYGRYASAGVSSSWYVDWTSSSPMRMARRSCP